MVAERTDAMGQGLKQGGQLGELEKSKRWLRLGRQQPTPSEPAGLARVSEVEAFLTGTRGDARKPEVKEGHCLPVRTVLKSWFCLQLCLRC